MLRFLSKQQLKPFLKTIFPGKNVHLKKLPGGLLNQNYTLEVNQQRFVLKIFRKEMTPEKMKEMNRVMEFVERHKIPVSSFLKLTQIDGHAVVLDRFISGQHPSRFKNTPNTVRLLGGTLGQIHLALDQFRTTIPKKAPQDLISWNQEEFLKEIQDLRQAARRANIGSPKELATQLDLYQRLVESDNWNTEPFLKLPIRLCQGDYHTQNILIEKGNITAILDWEKFGWQWRGFEIMRSLIFNCRKNWKELDWHSVCTYLKAYRQYKHLKDQEKELAYECGFRKMLFSLWVEKRYLETGDTQFLDGMKRRAMILPWLAEHRKESAERIADML